LVPSPGSLELTFYAEGLRADQSIRLIRDGASLGQFEVDGESWSHPMTLSVDAPTFVRLEVLEGEAVVALSNPLYVDPVGSVGEAVDAGAP
jgi:hypothetical protein